MLSKKSKYFGSIFSFPNLRSIADIFLDKNYNPCWRIFFFLGTRDWIFRFLRLNRVSSKLRKQNIFSSEKSLALDIRNRLGNEGNGQMKMRDVEILFIILLKKVNYCWNASWIDPDNFSHLIAEPPSYQYSNMHIYIRYKIWIMIIIHIFI